MFFTRDGMFLYLSSGLVSVFSVMSHVTKDLVLKNNSSIIVWMLCALIHKIDYGRGNCDLWKYFTSCGVPYKSFHCLFLSAYMKTLSRVPGGLVIVAFVQVTPLATCLFLILCVNTIFYLFTIL